MNEMAKYYEFYEEGMFTDAVITVGGVEFKVHKLILCAASHVFRAMFTTSMREGLSSRVMMDDERYDAFGEFLTYIYTGETRKMNEYSVHLLRLADKYGVDKLSEECESYLTKAIDLTSAGHILLVAHYLNRSKLKRNALNFIGHHVKEIINCDDWRTVASDYQLMTELILFLPEVANKKKTKTIEVVEKVNLKSIVTLEWKIPTNVFQINATSPDFDVVINNQVLTHRLKAYSFIDRIRCCESYKVVLCTDSSCDGSLTYRAEFVLTNDDNRQPFKNCVTVHCDFSKKLEDTLVFSLNRTELNTLTRYGAKSLYMRMIVHSSDHYCLLGSSRTDKSTIGRPISHKYADVQFRIGHKQYDGHRVILAGKSPFFENLFQNDKRFYDLTGTIVEKHFEIILDYLYTERTPSTRYMDHHLLEAAAVVGLTKLFSKVEDHLTRHLTVDDAVSALVVAHRFGSKPVKIVALNMIKNNVSKLATCDSKWRQMKEFPELLSELLSLFA